MVLFWYIPCWISTGLWVVTTNSIFEKKIAKLWQTDMHKWNLPHTTILQLRLIHFLLRHFKTKFINLMPWTKWNEEMRLLVMQKNYKTLFLCFVLCTFQIFFMSLIIFATPLNMIENQPGFDLLWSQHSYCCRIENDKHFYSYGKQD